MLIPNKITKTPDCRNMIRWIENNLFFRPWTGSIKTLGFHKSNVTCVLLLGEELTKKHIDNRMNINFGYVVISGDKKGEVKIWWDGGSAITCNMNHLSSVKELRVLATQVK